MPGNRKWGGSQRPAKTAGRATTRETGIGEEEAKQLIELVGTDWNSLLSRGQVPERSTRGLPACTSGSAGCGPFRDETHRYDRLASQSRFGAHPKCQDTLHVARNRRLGTSVIGNSQPDGEAVGAFQPMIEVFGCHRPHRDLRWIHHAWSLGPVGCFVKRMLMDLWPCCAC